MYKEETVENEGKCEALVAQLHGYGCRTVHTAAGDISAWTRQGELKRRRNVEGSPRKVCNGSHFSRSNQTDVGISRRLQLSDNGMRMLGARVSLTEALHSLRSPWVPSDDHTPTPAHLVRRGGIVGRRRRARQSWASTE